MLLRVTIGVVTWEAAEMSELRVWIVLAWIALPTVMYGGYSLLRLINQGNVLTPVQVSLFRAGHAHAGVLLLMSLLYYSFMARTALPATLKHAACAMLVVGILCQSGGFFVQMIPRRASLGAAVTVTGAVLLVCAIAVLVYGLCAVWRET
jgi:hypothetical protein